MAYKIVKDNCTGCSACEPECPNQAISETTDGLVIDPAKCTECIGHYDEPQCVPSVDRRNLRHRRQLSPLPSGLGGNHGSYDYPEWKNSYGAWCASAAPARMPVSPVGKPRRLFRPRIGIQRGSRARWETPWHRQRNQAVPAGRSRLPLQGVTIDFRKRRPPADSCSSIPIRGLQLRSSASTGARPSRFAIRQEQPLTAGRADMQDARLYANSEVASPPGGLPVFAAGIGDAAAACLGLGLPEAAERHLRLAGLAITARRTLWPICKRPGTPLRAMPPCISACTGSISTRTGCVKRSTWRGTVSRRPRGTTDSPRTGGT